MCPRSSGLFDAHVVLPKMVLGASYLSVTLLILVDES